MGRTGRPISESRVVGLFGSISNNWSKAQAAAIIQGFLEHQVKHGLFDGNPVAIANQLVAQVWAVNPALFEGKTGPKPHKVSIAAFALAAGVHLETHRENEVLHSAYALALGLVMDELSKNAHLYPFHYVDHQLLEKATETLSEEMDALEQSPLLNALGF